MMFLEWWQNGSTWHELNKLDTLNVESRGVYVIWYGRGIPEESVVYVGQGNVGQRLVRHQINDCIQRFAEWGIYVTWAEVHESQLNGVETYLYERLEPVCTRNRPIAEPISVNLPWSSANTIRPE